MTDEEARRVLNDARCTTPGRPAPGIEHCAACCAGFGYVATCHEEAEAINAALVQLGEPPINWYRR